MDITFTSATHNSRRSNVLRSGICTLALAMLPAITWGSDEEALTALLRATGGLENSPLASHGWGSGQHCSDWDGVNCDNGRVTKLDLTNYHLSGELPKEIGSLDALEVLNLTNNEFSGKIPDSIGELTKLKELYLSKNAFKGHIPTTFINLKSLTRLDLSYNMLLSSTNSDVDALVNQIHPNWQTTQLVSPSNLRVTGVTIDTVSLAWDPILYREPARYEIIVSTDASPDIINGKPYNGDKLYKVDNKNIGAFTVPGLSASTQYHLAIRALADKIPGKNGGKLVSDFSKTVSTYTLLDTDRDGVADINDDDADNDGLSNEKETLDADTDSDGIKDYLEPNNVDTDGDTLFNHEDDDDDQDTILTMNELGSNPAYPLDSDGDGIPDYLDRDSTNELGTADGSGDSDKDGLSDKEECPEPAHCADSDGDGLANYMDSNDDNDKLSTVEENPPLDSDSDGVINSIESNDRDTDNDGIRDHEDEDDDGDGRPTRDELGGNPLDPRDKDGDGIPDYLDADSDNKAETKDGSGDSDGDGISDFKECPTAPACPDANGNGQPSYMDVNEQTEIIVPGKSVLGDSENRGSGGGAFGLPLLGSLFAGMAFGLRRRGKRH